MNTINLKHIVSFLSVILFMFLAIGTGDDEGTQEDVQSAESAHKVTAVDLMNEYESNEVNADAKYEDKVIEVSGTINSIGKDITDDIYITLKTSSSVFTVQCLFTDDWTEKVGNLNEGDQVTVKGKLSGKWGNIMVRGCMLIK